MDIRKSFAGVTLGEGMRLSFTIQILQTRDEEKEQLSIKYSKDEVVNSWEDIPASHLRRKMEPHWLDEEGFRYYVPALMVNYLYRNKDRRYLDAHIGLIFLLDQRNAREDPDFDFLTDDQKQVIAEFLREAPKIVNADAEDEKLMTRIFDNYWSRFLEE